MCLLTVCGFGLHFAGFAILDVGLDLLKHSRPPETSMEGVKGVVDARMSVFIVELSEGLIAILTCFENLANLLAFLPIQSIFLEEMVVSLAFDPSSVDGSSGKLIRCEIVVDESEIVRGFFCSEYHS